VVVYTNLYYILSYCKGDHVARRVFIMVSSLAIREVGGFLVYNPQCLSTKANTWPEVMEYVRSSDVPKAYLPVGSVEAHGPHLPLDTDTIIAEYIARSVCNKIGGFLLPPINYGVLWALRPYPGSVHVEDEGS
jgi:hypothetical protein